MNGLILLFCFPIGAERLSLLILEHELAGEVSVSQSTNTTSTLSVMTREDIRQAIHVFAQALAVTPEFQALEEAADQLSSDTAAQRDIQAYQTRQQSLQAMLLLNAVDPGEQAELERLRQAFLSNPTVNAYYDAQENLNSLCQDAADLLSKRIGLSFTAACGPGCC